MDRLRTNPADVEARYLMGTVFLKHVSEPQGLIWLGSALAYEPDHGPTHHALAEYYAGKADEPAGFADMAAKHRELAEKAKADER
ncbi:MAG: hypothetical protein H0T47_03325 [Planctomycetaceae bacterium]|nr:hypothetical protein [Planctomycetaceae bacterium]